MSGNATYRDFADPEFRRRLYFLTGCMVDTTSSNVARGGGRLIFTDYRLAAGTRWASRGNVLLEPLRTTR
jgi:hypothetical protein